MSKSWGEIRDEALRRCGQKPPRTKADCIRAKSDEDLAYALTWANTIIPPWCAEHIDCPYLDEDPVPCYKCALEWLKQEANTNS